ncbi:MAG: Kelch repeat-containing protein [Polyangiales bacterium]
MSKRSNAWAVVTLALVACARSSPSDETLADASVANAPTIRVSATPPTVPKIAHPALAALRSFAPFARVAEGLEVARVREGWSLSTTQGPVRSARVHVVGGDLEVTVPTRANGDLRIAHAGVTDEWLSLRALDVGDVEATPSEGSLVFANAAPGIDVVHAIEPQRFEDLRLVRSADVDSTIHYAVTLGPAIASLRAHDDVVEALDRTGHVKLATEPLFAIDARGVREPLTVTIDRGSLVLALPRNEARAYPVAIDPSWYAPVATLNSSSAAQDFLESAPLLSDGRYLVPIAVSGKVQAYDPATDSFSVAPGLPFSTTGNYTDFTSTVLANGTVLMTGGFSPNGIETSAWLYDGKNPPVQTTNSMSAPRVDHTATTLKDGRVLVVGGGSIHGGATPTTSVDIFDPGTGKFTPVAATLQPHAAHSATLLNDGRVLVALGWAGGGVSNVVEVYDVGKNIWTQLTSLKTSRYLHQAVSLPDGRVAILGGATNFCCAAYTDVDIFDPTKNTFAPGAPMPNARSGFLAFLDNVGHLVVAGGVGTVTGTTGLATSDIYDPIAGTWSTGVAMPHPRNDGYYAVMSGSRVLWAGGLNASSYATDVFVYQPDALTDPSKCPTGTTFVDGVCCNSPCSGVCSACNTAGRVGACWPLTGSAPLAGHGTGSDCGLFVCSGGACATVCSGDSACVLGNYCDVATTKCAPQKTNGSGCAANDECVNGQCVDKVCCDSACTGACQACDATGSVGTCTTIAGPQHGARTGCAPYACGAVGGANAGKCVPPNTCAADVDCTGSYSCDPSSHACVAQLAIGATCARASACSSGFCVDGYCANSACTAACTAADLAGYLGNCHEVPNGSSPHGTTRTCAPYKFCGAAGCSTSCLTDGDCVSPAHCNGGACVGTKALGVACSANAECDSSICADGVCCATACGAACQSCAVTGHAGTCTAIDGAYDPHGLCAVGPCADACRAGACAVLPATSACGSLGSCTGHTLTGTRHCSGADTSCLAASAPVDCAGGLVCADATSCLSQCSASADCVTGYCDVASHLCASPPVDAGVADTNVADTNVADTNVADTTVVDTGAPDTYVAESGASDLGVAETPAPKLSQRPSVGSFQRCNQDSDCTTNHCVEGVCCDTACTQQCFSCALLSNPGICTQEPTGVDLKNECGPGDQCLGTCGPGAQCIGSGTGTMCARNVCNSASTGLGPAYCAAPGAPCGANNVVAFDCSPYACEPAFGACRNGCDKTSDCAQGFVCDIGSKSCVTAPTGAPSSGGCAIVAPLASDAPTSRGGLFAICLAAIAVTRRRRR